MLTTKEKIFNYMAKKVIKNGKIILIIWVVLFLLLLPFVLKANSVIGLNENGSSGISTQSQTAQNIMSSQFPSSNNNSSLIVVITAPDVLSNQTKNIALNITQKISSDKNIVRLSQIESLYNAYEYILANVTITLSNNSYLTKAGVYQLNHLLFYLPKTFLEVLITKYKGNISESSNASMIALNIATQNITNSTVKNGYYFFMNFFTQQWLKSFNNNSNNVDLWAILNSTLNTTAPPFIKNFMPVSLQGIALSDFYSFSINNYSFANNIVKFVAVYLSKNSGFPYWYVYSIASHGNYTYAQSVKFSYAIVKDYAPLDYPLAIPSLLLKNFVSPSNDTMIMLLEFSINDSYTVNGQPAMVSNAGYVEKDINDYSNVFVTGSDAFSYDSNVVMDHDLSLLIPITVIMIFLVTALYFRSVITPLITFLGIGFSIAMGYALIYFIGTYVAAVDFTVPTILIAILMAVGTDYSIFIISRYREELALTKNREKAMETALTWAGESIFLSGSTVIISFLTLGIAHINFIRTMGLIVGISVFIALLISFSLTPTIILIGKGHSFWPLTGNKWEEFEKNYLKRRTEKSGYFYRAGRTATKNYIPILVIAVLLSFVAAYGLLSMHTTYNELSALPQSMMSLKGLNALSSGFGEGYVSPTYILFTFNTPIVKNNTININAFNLLRSAYINISRISGINNITSPVSPDGKLINYTKLNMLSPIGLKVDSFIGKNNKTALFNIVLSPSPDSQNAMGIIKSIRSYLGSLKSNLLTGSYVGGESASTLDMVNILNSNFNIMEIVVVIAIFIVLVFALSSLPLPSFAIISVVLTISWTLALMWILFSIVWNYSIFWVIPIMLFIVLIGLGMDYNIFILTRIREESFKIDNIEEAISISIGETSGIITAAAVIMAASFGALFLSSTLLLKQFGFALPVAVLFDAMVVRTYIMPAFMKALGKWNWYMPGKKIK